MKIKNFLPAAGMTAAMLISGHTFAQTDNIYKDIMFSEEFEQQEREDNAKKSAASLLDKKPLKIKAETKQINRRNYQQEQAQTKLLNNLEQAKETYGAAPFGLVWGAAEEEIKSLGVQLSSVELKDYANAFEAKNLPSALSDFDNVVIVFGKDNKLWRILARSVPVVDTTPNAEKIMKFYKKYHALLSKKYGSPKQNHTAASAAGVGNLREKLNQGTADIYATFEKGNIGASLAIDAEGSNQFYLLIDYRNLKIFNENEVKVLEAL